MNQGRRSLLAAIGLTVPSGLLAGVGRADVPKDQAVTLRLHSFEQAVREAFESSGQASSEDENCHHRRIEVGHSDLIQAGVQGTHNDRPFAGFPAGRLRIVRTACEPGVENRGIRLYVATVDVVLNEGGSHDEPSRPLDFSTLPPAPTLC